MPSERLLYELPDGNAISDNPQRSPKLGNKPTRRARVWTVSEVRDRGDVFIVTVQRAARQDEAA
jgi:hypothetical protein